MNCASEYKNMSAPYWELYRLHGENESTNSDKISLFFAIIYKIKFQGIMKSCENIHNLNFETSQKCNKKFVRFDSEIKTVYIKGANFMEILCIYT